MTKMTRDQRNVAVLATCQMLFGTARSLVVSTAPLIAYAMATNKALATLPNLGVQTASGPPPILACAASIYANAEVP